MPLLAALSALLLPVLLSSPVRAFEGSAQGRVGLINTDIRAYGFSTISGEWTSTTLDSPAQVRLAGPYLGYLRTGSRVYVFNSTNDRWYSRDFVGIPRGEDVQGATAVLWTTRACYGIASVWSIWFEQLLDPRDAPRGGGSAGNFGLVWTFNAAYAFNAGTGQWIRQSLDGVSAGGIAGDGFGLVWTNTSAYAFNPSPGSWTTIDLNGIHGMSADGSGDVGVIWGQNQAQAFSRVLNSWFHLDTHATIQGGSAGGQIALLWDSGSAYAFNAGTGLWDEILLEDSAGVSGMGGAEMHLSVFPNPCTSGLLRITLPNDSHARIRLFDAGGSEIRSWDTSRETGGSFVWDTTDANGRPVASGTYWIRAESSSGRVEARRVAVVR